MKKPLRVRIYTRFKSNRFLNKIITLISNPPKPKKWVFIIGCYNSGTTLLAEILAKHPELEVLPDEGVMLTNELFRPEDFGWRRMWSKCENYIINSNNRLTSNSAKNIKKHWGFFLKTKRKIIIEKSISNILRIQYFQRHFNPAYFIHIQRDGYAVAEGIRRKAKPMYGFTAAKQYPIEFCIQQWVRSIEVFEENKSSIQNLYELSYEDLMQSPLSLINQLCDFLKVARFDKSMINQKFEVHGKSLAISNQNNKSYELLSTEEWGVINKTAEKELRKHGYFKSKKP